MTTIHSNIQGAFSTGNVGDSVDHGSWSVERKTIGYISPLRTMMVLVSGNRVESVNAIGEITDVIIGTNNAMRMVEYLGAWAGVDHAAHEARIDR